MIAFPLDRDAQRVVDAADKLLRLRSQAAREHYWRPLIQRMRSKLLKMNVDPDAAERALYRFQQAVQRALDDRADPRRIQPGGGGR